MTRLVAAGGVAAVLALSGCALASVPGQTQTGPFSSTCVIQPQGVANVRFFNKGGRDQKLGRFILILNRAGGKPLHPKTFIFPTPAVIQKGNSMVPTSKVFQENVTYRAAKCRVSKVRPN